MSDDFLTDLDLALNEEEDPNETSLIAALPDLRGDPRKGEYLMFRAIGFPVGQALVLVGIDRTTLRVWRETDPVLNEYETTGLLELQKYVGPHLIQLQFQRNMTAMLSRDAMLIMKYAALGLDALSDREWQFLKYIRSLYSPSDFLSLQKALEPERHQEKMVVELNLGGLGPRVEVRTVDAHYEELGPPPEGD